MGFSINPALAWDNQNFIVAWQDERNGMFEIMAQMVDLNGYSLGGNVTLASADTFDNESPNLAVGLGALGVVYSYGQSGQHWVRFGTFDLATLQPKTAIVDLTDGSTDPVYPVIGWNRDNYIVAWYDNKSPIKAIYATTLSADGKVIVPPTALTSPGQHRSRYPQVFPLGDRALLLYSDDRDGNDGYELYMRMFAPDLSPIGPEQRLTNAPKDSIFPTGAFGPQGDLGILFRDDRLGAQHVWFTRVGCTIPTP